MGYPVVCALRELAEAAVAVGPFIPPRPPFPVCVFIVYGAAGGVIMPERQLHPPPPLHFPLDLQGGVPSIPSIRSTPCPRWLTPSPPCARILETSFYAILVQFMCPAYDLSLFLHERAFISDGKRVIAQRFSRKAPWRHVFFCQKRWCLSANLVVHCQFSVYVSFC